MPSVGIPSSKMPRSTRGAFSAYTDAGPPERITAYGLRRRISSGVTRCPTSSEYTRASRTRRAISCAYCPPKSTTSTGRSSGALSGSGRISAPIVRRLLRDRHVVWMALAQPRRGDARELRALHLLDGRRTAVPHRLAQTADELMQDARKRALVRNAPLDPLRDELLDVLDVPLEVAVARRAAGAHRAERAHPAVLLEPFALVEDDLSGAFVRSRQQRARHDGVGAGRDRLRDVAGRRHPAVRDDRDGRDSCALVDRCDLRHPDSGDDARRADRVVHDRVVRDEAVRWAVHFEVVHRNCLVDATRFELLDDVVCAGSSPLRATVKTRAIRRPTASVTRAFQTTGRWRTSGDVRKASAEQEGKNAEELAQLARRIVEARASAFVDVSIAVYQTVVQSSQIERILTSVFRWQMLLIALSELPEHTRPLERPKVDVADPVFLDPRTDAGCYFDAIRELTRGLALVWSECPSDRTSLRVAALHEPCVTVPEERPEYVAEVIRGTDPLLVPRQLFLLANRKLVAVDLEAVGEFKRDGARHKENVSVQLLEGSPPELRGLPSGTTLEGVDVSARPERHLREGAEISDPEVMVRRCKSLCRGCDVSDRHDLPDTRTPGFSHRDRFAVHVDDTIAGSDVLNVLIRRIGHENPRAGSEAARSYSHLHCVGTCID